MKVVHQMSREDVFSLERVLGEQEFYQPTSLSVDHPDILGSLRMCPCCDFLYSTVCDICKAFPQSCDSLFLRFLENSLDEVDLLGKETASPS